MNRVATGSATNTSTTFSSGDEEGTVDATGEISSQDFQPLHQEHYAAGYSESGTTITTTYGPDGDETAIATTSQSSFIRTLDWDNVVDADHDLSVFKQRARKCARLLTRRPIGA